MNRPLLYRCITLKHGMAWELVLLVTSPLMECESIIQNIFVRPIDGQLPFHWDSNDAVDVVTSVGEKVLFQIENSPRNSSNSNKSNNSKEQPPDRRLRGTEAANVGDKSSRASASLRPVWPASPALCARCRLLLPLSLLTWSSSFFSTTLSSLLTLIPPGFFGFNRVIYAAVAIRLVQTSSYCCLFRVFGPWQEFQPPATLTASSSYGTLTSLW